MKYLLTLILALLVTSCAVREPVSTQSVVDDRPRITFEVQSGNAKSLELVIDGLSYGSVLPYLSDKGTLRVVAGQHRVELIEGNRVAFRQDVFLGEGTTRVFKVMAQ